MLIVTRFVTSRLPKRAKRNGQTPESILLGNIQPAHSFGSFRSFSLGKRPPDRKIQGERFNAIVSLVLAAAKLASHDQP